MNANSELYTCSCNRIQKVEPARCKDCARFKSLYTKQSNGSYKPADGIGYCSMTGFNNITDLLTIIHDAHDCKHFVPTDPSSYKQVWLKTPAN